MWRKFTVYGLRFSKTSFWNRINTGFLDPAVATVLTACGIETLSKASSEYLCCKSCNSAYRLRYWNHSFSPSSSGWNSAQLQQCLPLAVLKLISSFHASSFSRALQQCLPLAVLKPPYSKWSTFIYDITLQQCLPLAVLKRTYWYKSFPMLDCCCNSAYRLRYWNEWKDTWSFCPLLMLQQCLPLAVLKRNNSFAALMQRGCNSAYRLRYWNALRLHRAQS